MIFISLMDNSLIRKKIMINTHGGIIKNRMGRKGERRVGTWNLC